MSTFLGLFNEALFNSMLRISVPMILAGMCYVICARAGVTDMGLEGKMLFGAIMAVIVTDITGSPLAGMLGAMISTSVVAWLVGLIMIKLHSQQVIVGIGLNFLMQGLTTVLLAVLWGNPGNSIEVPRLSGNATDVLTRIPFIGGLFDMQTPILLITFAIVIGVSLWMFRTKSGLRLRSIGENPAAADCLGLPVHRYRLLACILGGMFCGLAGADLSIGQLGYFAKNMTSGRGYIALSCAIVGGFKPSGVFIAALLISLVDALQMRLQAVFSIPPQLVQIIPYIVPIIVISGFGGVRPPAAMGKPYRRGER